MTRNCHALHVLTIMVLFISLSFLHPSTSNPVSAIGDYDYPPREVLPRLPVSENMKRMEERGHLALKDQTEKEEELFKDVDPKRLAAVLLEALNHTHMERERDKDEEEYNSMEEEIQTERDTIKKEELYSERVSRNREREGQKELELFIASQGKERESEEEEEKKKALEEEEKITERVTSHTTSRMVQIQTMQQPSSSDGTAESGAASQQRSSNLEHSSDEEEEQLNPEELKSLETMMKEFPRLNTKRDEQNQRNTQGYSSYNYIIPINKGSDLAMTKKKLKWQEETQKAVYFPAFTGGKSVEESEYSNYISKATQPPSPSEQDEAQDDYTEEEDDEEILSPEEEEARAKMEQEEMMRQASEAQKAKMEEEKLADIASDMLLSYMGKQNKGDKKHSLSMSNAAEDKRSDEKQEVKEEEDLDPQTIDKLIEISSKLHLPADDVVDIITDVEKKKKKDVTPEMASIRQYSSPLSPFHSGWQVSSNQNNLPVSKQPSPAVNILKTWFQEKSTPKPDVSQQKLPKPLLPYNFSPKPEKPFSMKQERWFKFPKSVWTSYSLYPYSYSSYLQRKPILGYYPFYFPPIPRPKPHYHMPKPALTRNNYFGDSVEDLYIFPPRRYQSWVQPQLRKSPASFQPKSFYSSYYPRPYSQPFQLMPTSQANSPPQTAAQQKQFLISALAPPVTKNKDYHKGGKQSDSDVHDDVEKYIQQILMNKAQRLD
ncbi:uncharacterized protein vgf [Anableps anableps]